MNGENDKFWLDHQLAAARFLYELLISLFPVIRRRPASSSDRTFFGPFLTCSGIVLIRMRRKCYRIW